nr:11755_t:CDS:2 [Entrophospora candida]
MEIASKKTIEIKQVNKKFNEKAVLNNVSFSVRAGTIHGFIGPNGAGKSTTLNILVRLILPNGGEEYIDFKSPKIYLLDEPFNGLDPSFRHDLFDNLKAIREKGGTILMSTHILSDLQKLADDITMIKGGEIVYTGPKTDDIEETYEEYFVKTKKRLFEL